MAEPISLFEARSRILACSLPKATSDRVPLAEALGRHLAVDVAADEPWPTTDRSAMDGFAVRAGAEGLPPGTELEVVGESLAGHPFDGELAPGRAIRIMTGAVVPPGADAVVKVEDTSGFGGRTVECRVAVRAGQNVRPQGSEVAPGQTLIGAGRRIGPAEVGALAVLGRSRVEVLRKPVVAILATGDEVVPVEQTPAPHQLRESNSWALAAQVEACGARPLRLGIAPDEVGPLRDVLRRGLEEADVLLTIGGVSKGTHDLVADTLNELGVRTEFHGIRLKPGKPTFFGTRHDAPGASFAFGLPGNPASCFTVFDLLVRPLLLRLLGTEVGEWRATLSASGARWRPNARWQAVPGRLAAGADGALCLEVHAPTASGNPFGLLGGGVYGLLPPDTDREAAPDVLISGSSAGVELP